MAFKLRHTENLLKGRASAPGTRYFLTWCTAKRAPLLIVDPTRTIARQSLLAIDASGDGTLLAGTIMPDHIHLLLELGVRLTVSQVVAKIKAAITRTSNRMT
ncbi:transposase [Opitutus sp. GAS368]|jgi:REP element-mobilizing transposase RayT|uniref:transposase n=1 Tax=Opitutus sp. GAS368 TaxID=1882749 RepID=UPI0012FD4048|nr:transposase [Opitutus sp. GAS368]